MNSKQLSNVGLGPRKSSHLESPCVIIPLVPHRRNSLPFAEENISNKILKKHTKRRPSFSRGCQRKTSIPSDIEVVGTKSMEGSGRTEILLPKNSNVKTISYKLDCWNKSYIARRPKTREVVDWKIEPWYTNV